MADRIAIMGGKPFAEWIQQDGTAQRLYKAYCNKWPDNDTQFVAIGNEFYVRLIDGGMRHVEYATEFDYEEDWCAQCGTPIDPDGSDYYCCDAFCCEAVLCERCGDNLTCDGYYCPRHRSAFMDYKKPSYVYPYKFDNGEQFTFGVEIELESELSEEFMENVTDSNIIAGWNNDPSLERNGVELQSNILDMSKLPALRQIVEGIHEYGDNAGGHIHVARTSNQCASRWYWALHGLDRTQCERLNMRHMSDDYWCSLEHGAYTGKHTAVNNEHQDTIELRTFDCWYEGSADKLVPAVKWVRAMWRFFEKHPRGTVSADLIERYSSCMADNVIDLPSLSLKDRLAAVRCAAVAAEAERERIRLERAAKTRRRVEANVSASRRARASHGNPRSSNGEWAERQNRRARRRTDIDKRLSDTMTPYVFPSRNLRPLHAYLTMATARIVEKGETFRSLDYFRIYHAADGSMIWGGYEYSSWHGGTAAWVLINILRSRVARASHGKPTTESLERTALRLYKRAGRPELCERYARIREGIARDNAR